MDERKKETALLVIYTVLAILFCLRDSLKTGAVADAGEFKEDAHPRDKDGKFSEGGGGGTEPSLTTQKSPEENSGRSRNSPSVATLTGSELTQKPGESIQDAALRYYEGLANSPANRQGFGEVKFYKKSGWKKLESTSLSDTEKLKLLPAVKDIIEKGDYIGRAGLEKPREDGIIAFHYFEGNVTLNGGKRFVGVSVGEDNRGNKFYNLNQSPDALMQKKKARESARNSAKGLVPFGDSASGTLDESIADIGAEINILIL